MDSSQRGAKDSAIHHQISGRHALRSARTRRKVMLSAEEVEQLDWAFRRCWKHFINACEKLEKEWRSLRFRRFRESKDHIFEIASVSRSLWSELLEFVQVYDASIGNSNLHVFHASRISITVFTDTPTGALDPGYHLKLYAYSQEGIASARPSELSLGWSPPTSFGGEPEVCHPRGAWDAEVAHDWLFEVLLPAVSEWLATGKASAASWLQDAAKRFFERPRRSVDLSGHLSSGSRFRFRDISNTHDLPSLVHCVQVLQTHFNVYNRPAPIGLELVRSVLVVVQRLCGILKVVDDHYIRNKLSLGSGPIAEEVATLLDDSSRIAATPGWLDYALRALLGCIEVAPDLPESQQSFVRETLAPVWARMREDLLCESVL